MIKIYTVSSCSSCKKVKNWFDEHNISYSEKNLKATKLTDEEILDILRLSNNGVADVVSKRNKWINKKLNINELNINELISLIKNRPTILKIPIIIDSNKRLQIGFNDEEIELFLE